MKMGRLDEEIEVEESGYLLPVTNSPRMGVCGYEGSDFYPNQFEPDDNVKRKHLEVFSEI